MNIKRALVRPRLRLLFIAALLIASIAIGIGEFTGLALSAPAPVETHAATESAVLTPNTCESLAGGVIEVEGTGGSGTQPTGYATLGAAFIAINNGTHTGSIVIDVCGDTTEAAAGSVLNASGAGSASYSSIIIRPVGGVSRTITAATTPGQPMIDLNGADNVTIDGLNSGGNSLTITNTTVSVTSGTSTIRFINDATSNLLTNLNILGSSTMPTTTNGGTIFFSTAASGGVGNDNNTVSNSQIGPAGSNPPTKAIYSNGSTTSTNIYNSGIVFSQNSIFDFFNEAATSNGFYLANGTTDWTVSDNKLFQTVQRTHATGQLHSPIQVANNNTGAISITGNTIGYSSNTGIGTYDIVGVAGSRVYQIYFSAHSTATPSSIQGNTITNISVSGNLSGNPFGGIVIAGGRADIGNITGNVIGSATTGGAISVSNSSGSNSTVFGIDNISAGGNISVSNNTVGGITATNTSTGAIDLFGIRASTGSVSFTSTVQNNLIGFAAAPLVNNATSSGSNVVGIQLFSTTAAASGNVVSNMTMVAGNAGVGSSASMIGFWLEAPSSTIGNNISGNVIRNLSNTDTANNDTVTGLYYNSGNGPHVVQRNFIHGLSVGDAVSTTGTVNGIEVQTGSTIYQNNMIALGNGVTASNQISGIRQVSGGSDNFYHNSVYIGGTDVVGSSATYAIQSTIVSNNREYRDNIFVNARSNGGGTGKHYAVRMGGSGTNRPVC